MYKTKIKPTNKASRILTVAAAVALLASPAFGSLIYIGQVPSSGNGLGAVNSLVTFQNTGTEVGSVGVLPGGGGAAVTGAAVTHFGSLTYGGPTNEQTGSGNNVYTTTGLGITATGSNTFANTVLIFNGSEGGNAADQPITLSDLSLNLYSASGEFLRGFTLAAPFTTSAFFTGTGNAGFGFQLDAPQAAEANALFNTNPNLFIGASARATGANSGLETIAISRINSTQAVPDSGATVALLGVTLIGLAFFRRKFLR